jgi:hypothetical protein
MRVMGKFAKKNQYPRSTSQGLNAGAKKKIIQKDVVLNNSEDKIH